MENNVIVQNIETELPLVTGRTMLGLLMVQGELQAGYDRYKDEEVEEVLMRVKEYSQWAYDQGLISEQNKMLSVHQAECIKQINALQSTHSFGDILGPLQSFMYEDGANVNRVLSRQEWSAFHSCVCDILINMTSPNRKERFNELICDVRSSIVLYCFNIWLEQNIDECKDLRYGEQLRKWVSSKMGIKVRDIMDEAVAKAIAHKDIKYILFAGDVLPDIVRNKNNDYVE